MLLLVALLVVPLLLVSESTLAARNRGMPQLLSMLKSLKVILYQGLLRKACRRASAIPGLPSTLLMIGVCTVQQLC